METIFRVRGIGKIMDRARAIRTYEPREISPAYENYGNFNTDGVAFHRFRRSFGSWALLRAAYTLWPGKLKFRSGVTLREPGATFENRYDIRWAIECGDQRV